MQLQDGLNILIVTPFSVEDFGGVSTAVLELQQEFSKPPHTVRILAPSDSHRLESIGDCGVYGMYLRNIVVDSARIKGFVAFVIFFPVTLIRLWLFLRSHRIDVVQLQYPLPHMMYFAVLRRISRWKLVVTFQGNDAHNLYMLHGLNRRFLKSILAASDHITGVATSLIEKVRNQFPDVKIESTIVPNGARAIATDANPDNSVDHTLPSNFVLTVGQLIYRKGIDVLIEALAILKRGGSSIEVVAIGDGDERTRFKQQAEEAGVSDRIHFVGWKPHDQVLLYMRRCVFFALASREEGLPLVIAEAMLLRKTAVATNVDGIPDIVVDGITGVLVPPDDPKALAKAMSTVFRDKTLRHELEARAYDHAMREFTWKAVGSQYLKLFRNCVSTATTSAASNPDVRVKGL